MFTPDYHKPLLPAIDSLDNFEALEPPSEYSLIYTEVYLKLLVPFYKDGGEAPESVLRFAAIWAGRIANWRQIEPDPKLDKENRHVPCLT